MMPEKSRAPSPALDIALVDRGGSRAERGRAPARRRRFLRQLAGPSASCCAVKPGLIVAVGGRRRHRTRHRAIARHRPALARTISTRCRTASARRGRASRPARTLPTPRSSKCRGSCCCRSSRPGRCRRRRHARWSCPSLPGSASPLRRPSSRPPTMKVSVPPCAPPTPPETGASTISRPFVPRRPPQPRARCRHRWSRNRSAACRASRARDDAVRAEIDLAHFWPDGSMVMMTSASARAAPRTCRQAAAGVRPASTPRLR